MHPCIGDHTPAQPRHDTLYNGAVSEASNTVREKKSTSRKFYAIARGRKPGIYDEWPAAEPQIRGFAGAVYKGFAQFDEAVAWFREKARQEPQFFLRQPVDGVTSAGAAASTPAIDNSITAQMATYLAEGKVVIFTDGGADPNPGPGGYGVVMLFGSRGQHRKELSGGFRRTTNNRMEITACIQALSTLTRNSTAIIFTDSRYLADTIEKGWAVRWRRNHWKRPDGSPAINADLWAQMLDLLDQHTVSFVWVKGHAGTRENERCDWLATQAAHQPNLPVDAGFEP